MLHLYGSRSREEPPYHVMSAQRFYIASNVVGARSIAPTNLRYSLSQSSSWDSPANPTSSILRP